MWGQGSAVFPADRSERAVLIATELSRAFRVCLPTPGASSQPCLARARRCCPCFLSPFQSHACSQNVLFLLSRSQLRQAGASWLAPWLRRILCLLRLAVGRALSCFCLCEGWGWCPGKLSIPRPSWQYLFSTLRGNVTPPGVITASPGECRSRGWGLGDKTGCHIIYLRFPAPK